jgi:hypothetical protein
MKQSADAPSEIGAAFKGVLTGVGAVSEEELPPAAPIGIEALFCWESSDIMQRLLGEFKASGSESNAAQKLRTVRPDEQGATDLWRGKNWSGDLFAWGWV